jgi:hypothetical protein
MKAVAGAVLGATLVAGCSTSSEEVLGFPPTADRIVCSAAFRLSGPWFEGAPRDLEQAPTGCWGAGVWLFTAEIDRTAEIKDATGDELVDRCGESAGTAEPALATYYSFSVEVVDDGSGLARVYTMLEGLGDAQLLQLKISDDGPGDCIGDLALISADGTMEWSFRPSQTGPSITGIGDFRQYFDE